MYCSYVDYTSLNKLSTSGSVLELCGMCLTCVMCFSVWYVGLCGHAFAWTLRSCACRNILRSEFFGEICWVLKSFPFWYARLVLVMHRPVKSRTLCCLILSLAYPLLYFPLSVRLSSHALMPDHAFLMHLENLPPHTHIYIHKIFFSFVSLFCFSVYYSWAEEDYILCKLSDARSPKNRNTFSKLLYTTHIST